MSRKKKRKPTPKTKVNRTVKSENDTSNWLKNRMEKSPIISLLGLIALVLGIWWTSTRLYNHYVPKEENLEVRFYENKSVIDTKFAKLDYDNVFSKNVYSGYSTNSNAQITIKSQFRQIKEWNDYYSIKIDSNNITEVPFFEKEFLITNPTDKSKSIHSLFIEVLSKENNRKIKTFRYQLEDDEKLDEPILVEAGKSITPKIKFYFERFKTNFEVIQSRKHEITLNYMDEKNERHSITLKDE